MKNKRFTIITLMLFMSFLAKANESNEVIHSCLSDEIGTSFVIRRMTVEIRDQRVIFNVLDNYIAYTTFSFKESDCEFSLDKKLLSCYEYDTQIETKNYTDQSETIEVKGLVAKVRFVENPSGITTYQLSISYQIGEEFHQRLEEFRGSRDGGCEFTN